MQNVNFDIELRYAILRGVVPKCRGKEDQYVDFHVLPSRSEAKELCEGCPLLEKCHNAAQSRRPAWGVWGGRVYGSQKKFDDDA